MTSMPMRNDPKPENTLQVFTDLPSQIFTARFITGHPGSEDEIKQRFWIAFENAFKHRADLLNETAGNLEKQYHSKKKNYQY